MNPFYSRFRNKTEKELRFIIQNQRDYAQEAIEAAKHLLNLEEYRKEPEHNEQIKERIGGAKRGKKINISAETQIRIFLKGFTRGQFFTILSLTLFYWGMFEVFYLYSDERSFGVVLYPFLLFLIPITFILNHVFFRVEVKQNTYWGRVVNTLFLFSFMVLFRLGYQSFIESVNRYEFNFLGFVGILFAMVISAIVFELLVTLINVLLKAFKCPQL